MNQFQRPEGSDISTTASLPAQWARALAAAGIVSGLYGWLGGTALLFLLIFIALAMLGGLALQTLGPRKVELVRTVSPVQPTAGDGVRVTVSLSFRCRLPIPWMMIEESWTCGNHRLLLFPGFRRTFQYTYRLERLARGRQQLRSCRVSWGDLPGWFTAASCPEESLVFKVLPSPLFGGRNPSEDGARSGSVRAVGRGRTESEGESDIRNYLPGDPLNRVHWKNSARRGSLQSRVPEREKGRMLCVVLDNCPESYETPWEALPPRGSVSPGAPAFELAVSAAWGLLLEAERAGSYAQLFTGGWPEGMARYEGLGAIPARVLNILAEIAPDGKRTLARLLEDASRQWIPGMSVVVITGRPDREVALTLSRLLAQGIKVDLYYVWDREVPSKRRPAASGSSSMGFSAEAKERGSRSAPARSDKKAAMVEEGGGYSAPDGMPGMSGKSESAPVSALPSPPATICGSLGRLGAGLHCLESAVQPGESGEGRADERFRKPTAR